MAQKRKLIEVALPLEAINVQSARENYIYKGNPSAIHKWWAQRPLATARAMLFAQLVDDPSNFHKEYVKNAEDHDVPDPVAWADERVKAEREHLFALIAEMVDWDNLTDNDLFERVRQVVAQSTGSEPPTIVDPFAGGGTIPLEAQRLGLSTVASDLNPVAVLINKALMEVPSRFPNRSPVFPDSAGQRNVWEGCEGIAEDVESYGRWILDRARTRLGKHYPAVKLGSGRSVPPIAWIWARTVVCPNPACQTVMPLVRSWWLGKRKGQEAFVVPQARSGRVTYSVANEVRDFPSGDDGTVSKAGAICVACGNAADLKYIREEAIAGRLGSDLLAVVADIDGQRVYAAADFEQHQAAQTGRPASAPIGEIPEQALGFRVRAYGVEEFSDLFSDRQLTAMCTFSDLLGEARDQIVLDGIASGLQAGDSFENGGRGAHAYADAIVTYLAFALDKHADYGCMFSVWYPAENRIKNLFARQSIPMVWDFPEIMPFTSIGGGFEACVRVVSESLLRLPGGPAPTILQADAASLDFRNGVISTDPPYYDNIGYSDLSDFFYVWLRRALRDIYPTLLSTVLVPKAEELVANPFRHGGAAGARDFFEAGFEDVFRHARLGARDDYPITVYYAFKQAETSGGDTASTGWETILASMVRAGWTVTATWPVRSERSGRAVGLGANALASSVVVALRPRPETAPTTDRRGFISAMKRELGPSLRELQQGGIAPVDLPQSAIGPGMAVFSRYSKVIESDGSDMSVRSALARINEVLDELLTEQEGDFDPASRFAIAWYRGNGYAAGEYGDADSLARARATAVASMEREGILNARGGKVQLLRPKEFPSDYDVSTDPHTSAWEALHHAIRIQESAGIPAAGRFLSEASRRSDGAVDLDLVKELAYLLFQVAEKNGWTKDAISFNGVATSWSDLLESGRNADSVTETSIALDFDEGS